MTQLGVFSQYHRALNSSLQLKMLKVMTSELVASLRSVNPLKMHEKLLHHPNFEAFVKVLSNLSPYLGKEHSLQQMFNEDKIVYHHVASQKDFSIIALVIPAGLEFSLHNHPKMLGVTKLLSGSLLIESMNIDSVDESKQVSKNCIGKDPDHYCHCTGECRQKTSGQLDTANPPVNSTQFESRRFKVVNWHQEVLEPGSTSVVFPRKNNIHRIVAQTNSICLDLLMPDYHDESEVAYYDYEDKIGHTIIRSIEAPKEADRLIALTDLIG